MYWYHIYLFEFQPIKISKLDQIIVHTNDFFFTCASLHHINELINNELLKLGIVG